MTTQYLVPGDEKFVANDYYEAKDLQAMADRIIEAKPELRHLYDFTVVFFWKKEGGTKSGKGVFGKCRKVTGDLKALAPGADFMVWLAADHIRESEYTPYQVEAVLFHELLHTGKTEKGAPAIRDHDWTGFSSEVREYGLFDYRLQDAGAAFQQLRLEGVENAA